jgi:hypothetical protein
MRGREWNPRRPQGATAFESKDSRVSRDLAARHVSDERGLARVRDPVCPNLSSSGRKATGRYPVDYGLAMEW